MYIYHIAVLIEDDENLSLENELWDNTEELLANKNAEIVSVRSEELIGHNYGCCVKCGAWASDFTKDEPISSFSNGAQIDGKWYCDICLPPDHPNSF